MYYTSHFDDQFADLQRAGGVPGYAADDPDLVPHYSWPPQPQTPRSPPPEDSQVPSAPQFPDYGSARNPISLPAEPSAARFESSTRSSLLRRPSNEASPPTRPQEMESSGAGALAAPALPNYSHTPDPAARMTMGDMDPPPPTFRDYSLPGPRDSAASLDTPVHRPSINHFQASNVRESGGEELFASPTSTDAATAANILANTNQGLDFFDAWDAGLGPFEAGESAQTRADQGWTVTHNGLAELDSAALEEPEDVKAYAKLAFPDGDYFVTTFEVILGRDMDYYKQYLREEKLAKRAEQELEEYKLEPSQPSQPGDGDNNNAGPSSKSSQSLEGRPARALPSNFSEQGGAVSYVAHSEDEAQSRRAKHKRRAQNSKSSSTTSIAPASLHPSLTGDFKYMNPISAIEMGDITDLPTHAFVPVHPQSPEDIRKISKEHLLFSYNFDDETWEVHVLGSHAVINYQSYPRGSVVPLDHHDKITVYSLEVEFKLPDAYRGSPGPSRGTFASDDEAGDEESEQVSPLDTSPVRRLSNAMAVAAGESDEEDGKEDEVEVVVGRKSAQKKPKVKLNLKKKKAQKTKEVDESAETEKPVKLSVKQKRKGSKEDTAEQSPEAAKEAAKKPDKGKKPKVAIKEPANEGSDELTETAQEGKKEKESPPAITPTIEPGSIFEGVATEELPQKRKGPGRPPKNGFISKRDQSLLKRKLKEYEKRGVAPPPTNELLNQVRAEQKQKEAVAKAAARGEAPPEMPVVQSIEADATATAAGPDATPAADVGGENPSATPAKPVKKSSPKPPVRVAKSPSPMKPECEYTEDDLKKPSMTYVHILDEILKVHPIGKADLQELYDLICKRYPYFVYRVTTPGWQSSVRHNLLQHGRFMENGRSGKGKLWAINYAFPLEKEKKRRISPPQRAYQHLPNGQYPPTGQPGQMGQYGGHNYNTPYGQHPTGVNGQPPFPPPAGAPQPGMGNYYSPYAPAPGQPGASSLPPHMGQQRLSGTPAGQQPPHLARPPANGTTPHQQQQQQHTPQPTAPQQQQGHTRPLGAPQFQGIVNDIMVYRTQFLSGTPPNTPLFTQREDLFKRCTNFISNIFHGTSAEVKPLLQTEEERTVWAELEGIFRRYEHLRSLPGGSQGGTPAAVDTADRERDASEQAVAGAERVGGSSARGGVGQAVGDAAERRDADAAAAAQAGAGATMPGGAATLVPGVGARVGAGGSESLRLFAGVQASAATAMPAEAGAGASTQGRSLSQQAALPTPGPASEGADFRSTSSVVQQATPPTAAGASNAGVSAGAKRAAEDEGDEGEREIKRMAG